MTSSKMHSSYTLTVTKCSNELDEVMNRFSQLIYQLVHMIALSFTHFGDLPVIYSSVVLRFLIL
jgi:hypothetical protein